MKLIESPRMLGQLHITVTRPDGSTDEFTHPNLVVDTGLNFIVSRMKEGAANPMSHMAVGAGSTATAPGDAALGSELGRSALSSVVVNANAIIYNASFPPGVGTGAITEAGILNAATAGTMLCRTVFPVVNKMLADSVSLTWTVTISPAP